MNLSELLIPPPTIPRVALPSAGPKGTPATHGPTMTDMATIKMKFLGDLGNTEFYVSRVTPPVGMTAGQFRGYKKILEQVLLYLASAIRGISNIEHHPYVNQRLSLDDLILSRISTARPPGSMTRPTTASSRMTSTTPSQTSNRPR